MNNMKNIITFTIVAIIVYMIITFCSWNITWVATAHWIARAFYLIACITFSIPFMKQH